MEKLINYENELTFAEIEQFVNADWGYGRSLLHIAVSENNMKHVAQCFNFGIDVNKVDNGGKTALFLCKSTEIAKFLVDNGADVNIINKSGMMAVHELYTYKSNADLIKIDLIKYLAGITNFDLEIKYSLTLLGEMISREEKDLSLYKIVIPRTKNINRIDGHSRSYLMNAVLNKKYLDVIKMLIKAGIDLYIKDQDGKNFYDKTFKYVQKEIEKNYPEFMKRKDMSEQQRQRLDKLKHLNTISNGED
jgi:ankyrin repeat protein